MDIIEPEIIPENQRIRLLRDGDKKSVYKPVGVLAVELKRKPQTLREWAKLLLTYSPDFYQHFKPRTAYNPYVQEWLKRINDYDLTEPSSAPRPQIIEDYIQLNAPIFTFQNYLQELNNEYQTEVTIDNAIIIKAA
ncbi:MULTISPECIES: hypothetical protein [Planktothrix]|uniref:Uncharacterized protein n=1 Tax=Planktothrix rubescens CCAP 1459/22 TaxID=329571 RepID=A0A6J7ZET4_PLARU|nr:MULTISPECIES: hypothetical protein [Planktothrix]CAC5339855.1 protein of unknown function [Planktothrix rubescens NIVA-CYA 18]CAD5986753.1 hypothetical protein PCC7821_05151 [Planktothrix rubescens NIVA-CYA 18]